VQGKAKDSHRLPVACWLEAEGQEQEAAIHRVRAASCQEKLGQLSRAVTLLRAALSAPLSEQYRALVERQRDAETRRGQTVVGPVLKRGSRSETGEGLFSRFNRLTAFAQGWRAANAYEDCPSLPLVDETLHRLEIAGGSRRRDLDAAWQLKQHRLTDRSGPGFYVCVAEFESPAARLAFVT
jgi:hypothetical protein